MSFSGCFLFFPALLVFQTFACARKLSSEVSGNIILLPTANNNYKNIPFNCLYLQPLSHTLVSLVTLQGMKLSSDEFNAIFAFYDKVGSWLMGNCPK